MKKDFHQNLMDESYDLWKKEKNKNLSYVDFLDQVEKELSLLHKVSVIFGKLNYQVENGGFLQWYDNGYSCSIEELIETLEVNKQFNEVLKILENVRDSLEYLEDGEKEVKKVSYEYQDLFKETLKNYCRDDFDRCDKEFYKYNDKFKVKFNEWLQSNPNL